MRRIYSQSLLVALALLLVTWTPAGAAPITFTAVLDGPSESPPNASPGTGFVTVIIDDAANTLFVDVDYQDVLSAGHAAQTSTSSNGPGENEHLRTRSGPSRRRRRASPASRSSHLGEQTEIFEMMHRGPIVPAGITDSGRDDGPCGS